MIGLLPRPEVICTTFHIVQAHSQSAQSQAISFDWRKKGTSVSWKLPFYQSLAIIIVYLQSFYFSYIIRIGCVEHFHLSNFSFTNPHYSIYPTYPQVSARRNAIYYWLRKQLKWYLIDLFLDNRHI